MESMEVQNPTDWQQAHILTLRILQGQQVQMKKLMQMRTQEAKARIHLFVQQQDLSKKTEAQQWSTGPADQREKRGEIQQGTPGAAEPKLEQLADKTRQLGVGNHGDQRSKVRKRR
ncbi:hypothetical protein Y1Q_0015121 [Alligator mississippiensis]|uniref:Uncharacterized protein n=1 Tax=Alligator mississippiensis TaxID=8496 RepID=A0A151P911_ALLMI|nr:hypothetical protein Y1Q_0015121 [Alligator mississippiensis]